MSKSNSTFEMYFTWSTGDDVDVTDDELNEAGDTEDGRLDDVLLA